MPPGALAGEQFLQNHAADTIVKEAIVAAIEWAQAAEETGVVHRDNQHGQADDNEAGTASGRS